MRPFARPVARPAHVHWTKADPLGLSIYDLILNSANDSGNGPIAVYSWDSRVIGAAAAAAETAVDLTGNGYDAACTDVTFDTAITGTDLRGGSFNGTTSFGDVADGTPFRLSKYEYVVIGTLASIGEGGFGVWYSQGTNRAELLNYISDNRIAAAQDAGTPASHISDNNAVTYDDVPFALFNRYDDAGLRYPIIEKGRLGVVATVPGTPTAATGTIKLGTAGFTIGNRDGSTALTLDGVIVALAVWDDFLPAATRLAITQGFT